VCDTLCVRTNDSMVFAKNSDRPPDEAQIVCAHRARPAGGTLHTQYLEIADRGAYALVGSHPTWLWGLEHGVNEHGVAIGNERVWTVDDPRIQTAGLIGMDLVRLGLERARSADDALTVMTDAIAEHGQGGSGERGRPEPYFSSFLIADGRGGWVLETSARSWAARPVGNGSSISNRISLGADWTVASSDVTPGTDFDQWRSRTIRTSIADHRLAATRACIARRRSGPVDTTTSHASVGDVVATLRDHGNGPWGSPGSSAPEQESAENAVPRFRSDDDRHVTICMHLRDDQATTASFVAELRVDAPTRAWACLGSPCAGVFIPFFPPAVPPMLSDPSQWQRFARLRDRVERDRDALREVRDRFAPLETELWVDADAVYAAGVDGRRDELTVRAGQRVDAALTSLGV
jgi:secernin